MNTANIDYGRCREPGCDGELIAPTRRGMTAHPYVCDKCGTEHSHLKLTQDCLRVWNAGHPGSIYSANQVGVPEAFARIEAAEHELREHSLTIGKTRDGMSGFASTVPGRSGASRPTGLLACLLRRL